MKFRIVVDFKAGEGDFRLAVAELHTDYHPGASMETFPAKLQVFEGEAFDGKWIDVPIILNDLP